MQREAVRHIAFKYPRSLCNVQQLNIELHTYRSELSNASDLPTLLRHIWVDHGFRVFRNVPNEGWFSPLELRQLPEVHNQPVNIKYRYCCYNVQMVRSSRSPICAVTTAAVAASIAPAPIATASLAASLASLATTALRTLLGRFTYFR